MGWNVIVMNTVEEDGRWMASLELVTLDEKARCMGYLESVGRDKMDACQLIARYCLTLGCRDKLYFEDEQGRRFATADLAEDKTKIRLHGRIGG